MIIFSTIGKNILANGLALSLLGDLGSGMFFCTGYLVIDHFHDSMDTQSQSEVSERKPDDRTKLLSPAKRSNEAKLITRDRE